MKISQFTELSSPTFRPSEIYWKAVLWSALVALLAFYLLGSAVNVHWGNVPIPLAQAIGTIRWERALQEWFRDRQLLTFAVGAVCAAIFTIASSRQVRLAAVIAGFVFPAALIGEGAVTSILFGPLVLFGFLLEGGASDGEFYIEGMPRFAAVGVWLFLCLIFAIREVRVILGSGRRVRPGRKRARQIRSFMGRRFASVEAECHESLECGADSMYVATESAAFPQVSPIGLRSK